MKQSDVEHYVKQALNVMELEFNKDSLVHSSCFNREHQVFKEYQAIKDQVFKEYQAIKDQLFGFFKHELDQFVQEICVDVKCNYGLSFGTGALDLELQTQIENFDLDNWLERYDLLTILDMFYHDCEKEQIDHDLFHKHFREYLELKLENQKEN